MTTHIKTNRWAAGCAWLLAGALTSAASADALPLLMEYQFNETGTTAVNGVAGGTALDLVVDTPLPSATPTATDLHGANGSGVTGKAGDRALDLTRASGMGSIGGGDATTPRAKTAPGLTTIDQLTSFTLTGWFKTQNAIVNAYAVFFDFHRNSGASYPYGFELQGPESRVSLAVEDKAATMSNDVNGKVINDVAKWFFLAVTYDGKATTDNVKVYRGYLDDAARGSRPLLALVATLTLDAGTIAANTTSGLVVGNSDYNARPFDGYIDGVKIFGSKTDSTGALSLEQLQTVRGSIIPEPASLGLVAVGATLLLGRSRR